MPLDPPSDFLFKQSRIGSFISMFSFLVANIIRFMIKPIQSICLGKYFECLFVCVITYGSANIVMFILAYHTFPG